ncbi:hypothetical protein GUJ93_ZPchr0008g12436 [Zizania palustris]|uniref:Small ribosomal subunit protein mS41 SAM domain-containing protein n=1 Tax=Zizania palustris TaxID=103762 RepID=A0A8J5UVS9_ZIZPA|nr:hypothetical protein GUJ93_ZPchr0008g12436 [Zizania palustris]
MRHSTHTIKFVNSILVSFRFTLACASIPTRTSFSSAPELRRDPSTHSPSKFVSFSRATKVGVVEFFNGIGKGMEAHAAKVEEAVGGDLQRLLQTRTLRLKKLGIPCKHVSF